MAKVMVCDICRKETDEIVGKMFYSNLDGAQPRKSPHQNYAMHLDVGRCCAEKVKGTWRWRKRVSAKQYHASRRKSSPK